MGAFVAVRKLCLTAATALVVVSATAGAMWAQTGKWSVAAAPTLALRGGGTQSNEELAIVVGATRWPDGSILVADRGAYALHLFSAAGKETRTFGRKGKGPGEIAYPKALFRCGAFAMVYDIEGEMVSVFAPNGALSRTFRFSKKPSGRVPYSSACNTAGQFVHYGWENAREMKAGAFRSLVPLYMSAADSADGRLIATIGGSERWGTQYGTRPLPLGKESRIAIGRERIYAGENDSYEIKVFSLSGESLQPIRKPVPPVRVTPRDISDLIEQQVSIRGEGQRKAIEANLAAIVLPKTLPAYAALVVDADDNLWVQDFAHANPRLVTWTVFGRQGNQLAEVALPATLDIYEIGQDYILGRYLDPDEAVPEVRLYRLSKPN